MLVRPSRDDDGSRTEIGFPEVKLGIFPGWGGTARVPRMIGLANAVEMITGGEFDRAADASELGLISDIVPADDLLPAAVRLIRAEQKSGDYLQDRKRGTGRSTSAKRNSVSWARPHRP